MITVAIVEDHAIVRRGLISFLDTENGIDVVGEAETGEQALNVVIDAKPDVLLLDMDLPDMSGLEVVSRLKNTGAKCRILVLTMHDNADLANQAMKAGASGFVIKRGDPEELPRAIRKVSAGDMYISPDVRDEMLKQTFSPGDTKPAVSSLSTRETQVLIAVANGDTIAEIAERLCLSEGTIKTYKKRINEKLGISKAADIVRFCMKNGLISE